MDALKNGRPHITKKNSIRLTDAGIIINLAVFRSLDGIQAEDDFKKNGAYELFYIVDESYKPIRNEDGNYLTVVFRLD